MRMRPSKVSDPRPYPRQLCYSRKYRVVHGLWWPSLLGLSGRAGISQFLGCGFSIPDCFPSGSSHLSRKWQELPLLATSTTHHWPLGGAQSLAFLWLWFPGGSQGPLWRPGLLVVTLPSWMPVLTPGILEPLGT